jgi:hypothetical protein
MAEHLEALRGGKHTLDFFGNKTPKCPHCGNDFHIAQNEAWDLYDENDGHSVNCPNCERDFDVVTRCSYTFSTDEQEDEAETAEPTAEHTSANGGATT